MFVYQRVFLSWGKNVSWSEQVFDRNTFLPKNASENPTENKTKNLLCVETSIPEVLVLRRCSFDCPNPEESKLCRDGSIAWAHMDRIKTNRSIPEVLHLPPVSPWQSAVFLPFELLVHPFSQWIGLRENLQENPMILMGKSMVSCKFSLKPIHKSQPPSFCPTVHPIWRRLRPRKAPQQLRLPLRLQQLLPQRQHGVWLLGRILDVWEVWY